jgi:hypothetical protein
MRLANSSTNLKEKIVDKYKFFLARTKAHVGRVKRNVGILAEKFPDIGPDLLEQVKTHDDTKYQEPEYTPYVEITWRYKCQAEGIDYQVSDEVQAAMNEATMHHIKSNKHHPEYWDAEFTADKFNHQDRDSVPDQMVDGRQMNKVSIAEMCCDWVSMAQEKQNSNSAHGWADMNVNKRWRFSDEQVGWIYLFLDTLRTELDEIPQRTS